MPNPWLDVLTGFNQAYNRGAQNYEDKQNELQRQKFQSQEEKQRQEDEFQRQKDLFNWENQIKTGESRQQQNDIQDKLSSLISGKNTTATYNPNNQVTLPGGLGSMPIPKLSQTDMTPQDKMRTLLGLPASVQNEYEKYQKQQEDQAQTGLVNQALNETDPEKIKSILPQLTTDNLKRYSEMKSAAKQPEAKEEWIKDTVKNGYHITVTGIPAEKGEKGAQLIDGKWYKGVMHHEEHKVVSQDEEGNLKFAPETKKILNEYFTKQQKNKATAQSTSYSDTDHTIRDAAELKRVEHNRVYSNYIKSIMPDDAKKFYDAMFNKAKGNPSKEDYWNNLKEYFMQGKLGDIKSKDAALKFDSLREMYRALYEEDPNQTGHYFKGEPK